MPVTASSQGTPPGFRGSTIWRQVSWLADASPLIAFPGLSPQWCLDEPLSAYSCGGSCGIEPVKVLTAFPFHSSSMEETVFGPVKEPS